MKGYPQEQNMRNSNQRHISRELIVSVNQGLIDQRRVDMTKLPHKVSDSIRSTQFTREQINRSFEQARRRTTATA